MAIEELKKKIIKLILNDEITGKDYSGEGLHQHLSTPLTFNNWIIEHLFESDDFFKEYFRKKSCYIKPKHPVQPSQEGIFSIDDFEQLLWYVNKIDRSALEFTNNTHAIHGGEIKDADILTVALSLFKRGYTIVINYADRFHPVLKAISRSFENLFHSNVEMISVFLNPPNTNCYKAHFDNTDVFAIQLDGSKTWELGRSLRNPNMANEFFRPKSTDVNTRFTMDPGDILYVPQGTVHQVFCTEKFSLHASIGLDVVQEIEIGKKVRQALFNNKPDLIRSGELENELINIDHNFNSKGIMDHYLIQTIIKEIKAQLYYEKFQTEESLPNHSLNNFIVNM